MFSAPSSLSPLEELFGISNTDFPQNEGANCLDSVYSNDLDFTNVNRQTPPEPTTTLKDITRDEENMSNSERNGEQMSDSRNDALSIIPVPPPAPPPPKLFGPNTSQNEQLLEKTGRAINLSPLRNNTSPNMEHLEKKLDLLQGMILKLMESVSQEKNGQYLSPSTASYQIPSPKVKVRDEVRQYSQLNISEKCQTFQRGYSERGTVGCTGKDDGRIESKVAKKGRTIRTCFFELNLKFDSLVTKPDWEVQSKRGILLSAVFCH